MHVLRYSLMLGLLTTLVPFAAAAEPGVKHVEVIKEEGRFSAWPANRGIWSWDNEILTGVVHGHYKKNPTGGHDIDSSRKSDDLLARSLDGGETWTIEERVVQAPETDQPEKPFDFTAPDVALNFRGGDWFISHDRGHNWVGPYALPDWERPGLLARTDYIVESPQRVTAFIAAEKTGGSEGQALCIRTTDGGQSWNAVGWIGGEPPAEYGYAIMPATVSLGEGNYLSFIRRGGVFDGEKQWWIEPYLSPDDGESWYLLKEPRIDNAGNPATLTRLASGNLALTYGWRKAPYGIRARISTDNGQTWGNERILRADGASWDIGYPRTVQRPDGKCVTVYYFHDEHQPERYIAATIWDPEARRDD
jgi:hypothetical protein